LFRQLLRRKGGFRAALFLYGRRSALSNQGHQGPGQHQPEALAEFSPEARGTLASHSRNFAVSWMQPVNDALSLLDGKGGLASAQDAVLLGCQAESPGTAHLIGPVFTVYKHCQSLKRYQLCARGHDPELYPHCFDNGYRGNLQPPSKVY